MSNFAKLAPFDAKGRVRMVVETPRGSSTKFKFDEELQSFTVSRTLAMGIAYPFDWGFVPSTRSADGDAVDALCIHYQPSFPGVVLPCRCLAVVDVDQQSKSGRVGNPRVILAPAWEGSKAFASTELSERAMAEIETFFLNATLFTDKDARIIGWRGSEAAEQLIRECAL
ncbi:inorganic diphosphatase [Hyphomicrobium sp.]|uniref:inorganic diphosphatase n=1 Tax=Hyphomicrobium sp. TaxID=82 RepID=UPI002E368B2D|nr:inorganic diphosphatase [Hyphomicrobium sp.]HEX2842558.1 inorganic diphosphatase [Hyphomicrobium sp.]